MPFLLPYKFDKIWTRTLSTRRPSISTTSKPSSDPSIWSVTPRVFNSPSSFSIMDLRATGLLRSPMANPPSHSQWPSFLWTARTASGKCVNPWIPMNWRCHTALQYLGKRRTHPRSAPYVHLASEASPANRWQACFQECTKASRAFLKSMVVRWKDSPKTSLRKQY